MKILILGLVCIVLVGSTFNTLSQRVVPPPGTGLISTGGALAADTAYLTSQLTMQRATPWRCVDTNVTGAIHSCKMVPVGAGYVDAGGVPLISEVIFTPGFSAPGGAECLNINAFGCLPLIQRDGVSTPTVGQYKAHIPIILLFSPSLPTGCTSCGAFVIQ